MERDIIEHNGKTYFRMGDKAIPFDRYDQNGKPIIRPVVENITHPDGRKDVIVHIPCLTIQSIKT